MYIVLVLHVARVHKDGEESIEHHNYMPHVRGIYLPLVRVHAQCTVDQEIFAVDNFFAGRAGGEN